MSAGNMKKPSQLESTWSGLSQAYQAPRVDRTTTTTNPVFFTTHKHHKSIQIIRLRFIPYQLPESLSKSLASNLEISVPPRHSPNWEDLRQGFIERPHTHTQKKKKNFPYRSCSPFYISPQEVGQRVNDSDRPVTYNGIQGSTSSDPLHCSHSGPPLLSNLLAACLSAWSGEGKDCQCISMNSYTITHTPNWPRIFNFIPYNSGIQHTHTERQTP